MSGLSGEVGVDVTAQLERAGCCRLTPISRIERSVEARSCSANCSGAKLAAPAWCSWRCWCRCRRPSSWSGSKVFVSAEVQLITPARKLVSCWERGRG